MNAEEKERFNNISARSEFLEKHKKKILSVMLVSGMLISGLTGFIISYINILFLLGTILQIASIIILLVFTILEILTYKELNIAKENLIVLKTKEGNVHSFQTSEIPLEEYRLLKIEDAYWQMAKYLDKLIFDMLHIIMDENRKRAMNEIDENNLETVKSEIMEYNNGSLRSIKSVFDERMELFDKIDSIIDGLIRVANDESFDRMNVYVEKSEDLEELKENNYNLLKELELVIKEFTKESGDFKKFLEDRGKKKGAD